MVITSPWITYGKGWIIDKTLLHGRVQAVTGQKYRSLRGDLEPLLTELAAGKTPGDRLQVTGAVLYKARIRNRDANRGESGGYRVIYYLKTRENIILVTLYSKSDQSDIQAEQVQNIIDRYPSE